MLRHAAVKLIESFVKTKFSLIGLTPRRTLFAHLDSWMGRQWKVVGVETFNVDQTRERERECVCVCVCVFVCVCMQDEATEKLSAWEREREGKTVKEDHSLLGMGKGPGVCVCSFVRLRGVCLLACSLSMSWSFRFVALGCSAAPSFSLRWERECVWLP